MGMSKLDVAAVATADHVLCEQDRAALLRAMLANNPPVVHHVYRVRDVSPEFDAPSDLVLCASEPTAPMYVPGRSIR